MFLALSTLSTPKAIAIGLIIAGIVLILCSMGGCAAASSYANTRNEVTAVDAGVKATKTLLVAKTITQSDAQGVSIAAKTSRAALASLLASEISGNTSQILTATTAAENALTVLNQTLTAYTTNNKLVRVKTAKLNLAGFYAAQKHASISQNKKVGEIAAALEIIQLVSEIAPPVIAWINSATTSTNVTAADVQTALDALDLDIKDLDALLATPLASAARRTHP